MRRILTTSLVVMAIALGGATPATAAGPAPTCSSTLGIVVHGQHIVGDYLTGIGRNVLAWPPSGGIVGQTIAVNGGIALAGAPGPGHFSIGLAPGASVCLSQSQGENGVLHQSVP